MFLLVPAHPGFPGQIPQSRKTVVCCTVVRPVSHDSDWAVSAATSTATQYAAAAYLSNAGHSALQSCREQS